MHHDVVFIQALVRTPGLNVMYGSVSQLLHAGQRTFTSCTPQVGCAIYLQCLVCEMVR